MGAIQQTSEPQEVDAEIPLKLSKDKLEELIAASEMATPSIMQLLSSPKVTTTVFLHPKFYDNGRVDSLWLVKIFHEKDAIFIRQVSVYSFRLKENGKFTFKRLKTGDVDLKLAEFSLTCSDEGQKQLLRGLKSKKLRSGFEGSRVKDEDGDQDVFYSKHEFDDFDM